MDLSKVANDIEGLFQCIGVLVGIVILAAIIAAIVFGGTITTFFGSMMGAALNRTIAEREYLEQADKQGQPVSAYHSEEDNAKFEQSTARGCSFQIMAALVGGAMLWIMFGVFMERNFGEEDFWPVLRSQALPPSLFTQYANRGASYYSRKNWQARVAFRCI